MRGDKRTLWGGIAAGSGASDDDPLVLACNLKLNNLGADLGAMGALVRKCQIRNAGQCRELSESEQEDV